MCKYDSKGNKTEFAQYNPDGSLTKKDTYKYDSDGYEISGDGPYSYKSTRKYNSKGNLTEVVVYDVFGKLRSRDTYTYKYDFGGNITEITEYDAKAQKPHMQIVLTITYRK